jgi:hypothetical protein
MVLLDTYVAGCVHSWLANRGELDVERWNVLAQCMADLDRVLPALSGAERTYFDACRTVGRLVLESEGPGAKVAPGRPRGPKV